MTKKITLILLLFCVVISCGKKGDPEYKSSSEKIKLSTIIINKVS